MSEHRPGPIPNSYWIPGQRVVAGEYPGAISDEQAREKVRALLTAGVDTFIDLTHPTTE